MGEIRIDSYVLDPLMRDLVGHDRQPSAFLVYLSLWSEAFDSDGWSATVSLRQIAERTGLSKRAVQDAIGHLHRRKLIQIDRRSATAVPTYTVRRPWAR